MKYLFLACCVFWTSYSLAQANYHAGHIVLNNGDTIRSYINTREWAQTPKSIEFKHNFVTNAARNYNPKSIKAFEITGIEQFRLIEVLPAEPANLHSR